MMRKLLSSDGAPPPPDDDPYGGGSADMFYEGPSDWEAQERREREAKREAKAAAAEAAAAAENDAAEAGDEPAPRQTDDLPPGMSIDDWWDRECSCEYTRLENLAKKANRDAAKEPHEERRERELAAGPPPRREQEKYGPRGDAAGDAIFRKDREAWYQRYTGRSIADISLQEQNEVCDAIARRFREYTDGRM